MVSIHNCVHACLILYTIYIHGIYGHDIYYMKLCKIQDKPHMYTTYMHGAQNSFLEMFFGHSIRLHKFQLLYLCVRYPCGISLLG